MSIILAGCDDGEKRKALAEAAQAKVELVKLRAEIVKLKGEISYLRQNLQTENQARDNLQQKLDQLLEEKDTAITEAQDNQQQNDNLVLVLAEQTKKANDLEKQVEQLRAVILELQAAIEQQITEQPQSTEQIQDINNPPPLE